MRRLIPFLLIAIFSTCSRDTDTKGVYTGKVDLRTPLLQFTATSEDTKKEIILTKTGANELSFTYDGKTSHLDYEETVIIIKSLIGDPEWSAKKVKGGFELEDGTLLHYEDCPGWAICLFETKTNTPILKGGYTLSGGNAKIRLWISESEKHVELLGLMANGLINKSRDEKQSNEASLETPAQGWVY